MSKDYPIGARVEYMLYSHSNKKYYHRIGFIKAIRKCLFRRKRYYICVADKTDRVIDIVKDKDVFGTLEKVSAKV